jgi:hypothetical protein
MSNKSRRRATTSRHRVAMAAGAIVAGAAIPIAAAGTAWADDTSETSGNIGPVIPVAAAGTASVNETATPVTPATPSQIPTVQDLENRGLTPYEANAVVTAAGDNTPVDVSYNGKNYFSDNQGSGSANEAAATSAKNDISVAIGGGTDSTAKGAGAVAFDLGANSGTTGGNNDDATASGKNATATINDSTNTMVSAGAYSNAASSYDSGVKVTASGFQAQASSAFDGSNTTVSATGTNANASAFFTGDSAVSATGKNADAMVSEDTSTAGSQLDVTAKGTNANASVVNQDNTDVNGDSKLTVTAGANSTAQVFDTTGESSSSSTVAAKSGGTAYLEDSSNNTAVSATGNKAEATAQNDSNVTVTATGRGTDANGYFSIDSSATAKNTQLTSGGITYDGYAQVEEATGSKAIASGGGSIAWVDGSATYPTLISGSEAQDTNGTLSHVVSDNTTVINGVVQDPRVEMTPVAEVHEMHMMPTMPLP